MKIEHEVKADGSLGISLSFDPIEVTSLLHDLPGVDGIVDWFSKGPSNEKIFRCKERMMKEGMEILKKDESVKMFPTDEDALVVMIKNHANYMDRKKKYR